MAIAHPAARVDPAAVMRATLALIVLLGLLAAAPRGHASPVAYTDQTAFLTALAAEGLTPVHETFEGDGTWGTVRSTIPGGPQLAPSVTSKGVTWTSNFAGGQITTSNGAARSGNWGVYANPHGAYDPANPDCFIPGGCGDGVQGAAQAGETLYAVGGWLRTNTPYASVGLYLGGYPNGPLDFGETCDSAGENCVSNSALGTAWKFFGAIETVGFSLFEFRELEGKLEPGGGDVKYIFADDVYLAGSALGGAPAIPLPAAAPLMIGALAMLGAFRRRTAAR